MSLSIKKWGFLLPYLLIAIFFTGCYFRGWFMFGIPLTIFVLVPLLDILIGVDRTNPTPEELSASVAAPFFKWLTLAYVPFQYAMIGFALWFGGHFELTTTEWIGLVLSLGILTGGIGITIAHELGHKSNPLEQTAGQALLASVCYTHFYIEHNQGHHANVSTPEDPASAQFNESLYRFLPRTLFGCYLDAWKLENRKFQRRGLSPWSVRNRMIWYSLMPLALATLIYPFWQVPGLILFFGQSVVAVLLLEVVNYIEHYGLTRNKNEKGNYERVNITHSWNANHLVTNWLLFHLQRHSDHHANASRRYQVLRHFDESPQLPTGYAGMILVALCPPLWFWVMNPKVRTYYHEA